MRISGSDIHLLSIFGSVVRNGGFSAAQAELGLSQPTISNHITALEDRLGVKLCQRGRRGFLLTEKGHTVYEIGKNLADTINYHSNKLSELKGHLVGSLRVGAVDCLATDLAMKLPECIKTFVADAPAVSLELSQERPQDILSKVLDGGLHIGFGSFDNIIFGLEYEDLYAESHAIYCGVHHPLFTVADSDVNAEIVEKSAKIYRKYWSRQRLQALQIKDIDRSVDEIESQLLLVLSGQYVALLPEHLCRSYVAEDRLRRLLPDQEPYVCLMQMVTKSGQRPMVIETFCRILREAHGL